MPKREEKIPVKSKQREGEGIVERNRYTPLDEFDRLFNQFRSRFNDLFYQPSPRRLHPTREEEYRPPLADVIDHGDRFEMTVELPGISKEDINVEVTPYNIELSAQKSEKEEEKGKNWLKKERNVSYYRSFDFQDEIEPNNVEAEMKDGVLTINMPKQHPTQTYESKEVKIK